MSITGWTIFTGLGVLIIGLMVGGGLMANHDLQALQTLNALLEDISKSLAEDPEDFVNEGATVEEIETAVSDLKKLLTE